MLVAGVIGFLLGIMAGFELCASVFHWSITTPERCQKCEKEHHA